MNRAELIDHYVEKYQPLLHSLSYKRSNRIASPGDLYQEGVMAIIHAVDRFKKDEGNIDSFIYRCIKNKMTGTAFENSFAVHIPSGSLAGIKDQGQYVKKGSIHENIKTQDESVEIADLEIEEFVEAYDKFGIGKLYFLKGLTYREISEKTGHSISSISRQINQMKDKFRKFFE